MIAAFVIPIIFCCCAGGFGCVGFFTLQCGEHILRPQTADDNDEVYVLGHTCDAFKRLRFTPPGVCVILSLAALTLGCTMMVTLGGVLCGHHIALYPDLSDSAYYHPFTNGPQGDGTKLPPPFPPGATLPPPSPKPPPSPAPPPFPPLAPGAIITPFIPGLTLVGFGFGVWILLLLYLLCAGYEGRDAHKMAELRRWLEETGEPIRQADSFGKGLYVGKRKVMRRGEKYTKQVTPSGRGFVWQPMSLALQPPAEPRGEGCEHNDVRTISTPAAVASTASV